MLHSTLECGMAGKFDLARAQLKQQDAQFGHENGTWIMWQHLGGGPTELPVFRCDS